MPCPPCLSPPRCFRLCRGCTPRMRFLRDAAKSQRSPAPLGRPRLRCMCVCVGGDVMFLCRSVCFVLSGRLLCGCFSAPLIRPLLCLRSRFRFQMLVWFVACPAAFVCAMLCAAPVRLLTPRTAHTHTSHTTQNTHTPHTSTHLIYTIHHIYTTPRPLITHIHPPPVTHTCAYANLGWYALCDISGMHSGV